MKKTKRSTPSARPQNTAGSDQNQHLLDQLNVAYPENEIPDDVERAGEHAMRKLQRWLVEEGWPEQ
jgi:hypothetical protein